VSNLNKLEGVSNYISWSFYLQNILMKDNSCRFVDPIVMDPIKAIEFTLLWAMALTTIALAINDVFFVIANVWDPRDSWGCLAQRY
jgi:hypothetical protein